MTETNAVLDPAVSAPVKAQSVFDKAICFIISLKSLGNTRQVQSSLIEVDADKGMVNVSKKLLDSPEYRAISKLDDEIRAYLWNRSLPSLFRRGIYLLPLAIVEEVDRQMEEYAKKRDVAVAAFKEAYPERVKEAEKLLKGLFNPTEYPDVKTLDGYFKMRTSYVSFSTPDSLKSISSSFWEKEKARAESQWQEAAEEIRQALRLGMADLVSHMISKLTDGEEGKPKRFTETSMKKLRTFFETFDTKNITDDAELAAVVTRAKEIIGSSDAEALRKESDLREVVVKGFSELRDSLDKMIEETPTRKIVLKD